LHGDVWTIPNETGETAMPTAQERYQRLITQPDPDNRQECEDIQAAIQSILDTYDDPLPPQVAAQLRALAARASHLHCDITVR
jgi:hypothetical protein